MRLFSKVVLAAVLVTLAISVSTKAQTGDNDGCSNATLNGDYAFTVSGTFIDTIPQPPPAPAKVVPVQRLGVAMTHFNGTGGLTQVDFVVSNVPPPGVAPTDPVTGFHTGEWGTYTVHSDCTGTFIIHFPDFTTPVGNIPGAIIVTNFVLSNHGRSIHTVVTSLTPPVGTASEVFISSEGHKLGIVGQED
jgi:hypothetical protein